MLEAVEVCIVHEAADWARSDEPGSRFPQDSRVDMTVNAVRGTSNAVAISAEGDGETRRSNSQVCEDRGL